MTCAEFNTQLDDYLNDRLSEQDARALELHAAECAQCGEQLENATRRALNVPIPDPPPGLRSAALSAVRTHKTVATRRRRMFSIAAIAATVIVVTIARPARKSATDFKGAGMVLYAMDRSKAEIDALDRAEQEINVALSEHPGDSDLTLSLARIRRLREAIRELVKGAAS